MAEEKEQPEETEQPKGKQPPKRRAIPLGEVSGLMVGVSVGLYILGLVSLWVPWAHTYTGGDYATAWYAVSLIPRTTVIGQGLWLGSVPLLMTLVFTFVVFAPLFV